MSSTDALLALLGRQQDVLTRLLELCRDERACLLNSELPRLDAIVHEQTALLTEQARLSTHVVRAIERVGEEMGLEGHASLARLAEQMQGTGADACRARYEALSTLADEVQREGRINWHLAHQALKYVDFMLKLVGRAKEGPLPYSPYAQPEQHRPMQLLMDSSA